MAAGDGFALAVAVSRLGVRVERLAGGDAERFEQVRELAIKLITGTESGSPAGSAERVRIRTAPAGRARHRAVCAGHAAQSEPVPAAAASAPSTSPA